MSVALILSLCNACRGVQSKATTASAAAAPLRPVGPPKQAMNTNTTAAEKKRRSVAGSAAAVNGNALGKSNVNRAPAQRVVSTRI